MKVLLICDSQIHWESLDKLFKLFFPKLSLVCSITFKDALVHFSETPLFVMIDAELQSDSYHDLFIKITQLTNKKCPIIVTNIDQSFQMPSDFFAVHKGNNSIQRPLNPNEFRDVIGNTLKVIHEIMLQTSAVEIKREDCLPIKIRNFYRFKQIPYDVYLELSAIKFVRIINRNEEFSTALIQKFIKKKVKFFYLEKEEHLKFLERLIQSLMRIFKTPHLSAENVFLAQSSACSVIHEHVRTIGITNKVIILSKQVIEATIRIYSEINDLKELLKFFPFEGKDMAEQSVLTGYVSSALLNKMGWNSDMSHRKLGLAALLHDGLLSNDDLLKITSIDDPNLSMFTEDEREEYRTHPTRAAEVALDFQGFSDTDFIIAQHHELPSGKGFPQGLNSTQLTSLACIFILANNFVGELSQRGINKQSVSKILKDFVGRYNEGNFKQPLKALTEFFI